MKWTQQLTKGIVRENPVLRLVLGTCPTLAVTTAAVNGIGMGVAATLVLLGSNVAISLLRKVIPDKVRIPAYITIIAAFVTIIQMLIKAFMPSIDEALGIYLPLIVVNCIILGRAEMFASKNPVLPSALDAIGMDRLYRRVDFDGQHPGAAGRGHHLRAGGHQRLYRADAGDDFSPRRLFRIWYSGGLRKPAGRKTG